MGKRKRQKDRFHTRIVFLGDKPPIDKIHHSTIEKSKEYVERVRKNADWNDVKCVQIIERSEQCTDVVLYTVTSGL